MGQVRPSSPVPDSSLPPILYARGTSKPSVIQSKMSVLSRLKRSGGRIEGRGFVTKRCLSRTLRYVSLLRVLSLQPVERFRRRVLAAYVVERRQS